MTKTTSRRKGRLDPAVFLEAARRIGQGENVGACNACVYAEGVSYDDSVHRSWFEVLLRPPCGDHYCFWYDDTDADVPSPHAVTARIIGLTLCALLVEEGFRP